MSIKCTTNSLDRALMDVLEEYDDYVNSVSPQAVRRVANKCRRTIRAAASAKFGGSGDYANSWSTKVTEKNPHEFQITVYSKMPGLPHLLEFGHIKKTPSGQVRGRVSGRTHIKSAEVEAITDIMKEMRSSL